MSLSMDEYASAVEYLVGLKQRGVQPGLERMLQFAAAAGNPEQRVPCVHIAGTNGKGSVAAMLEAMFRAAGWKTGLYTSPHLVRLGERIQVNRTPISDEGIASHVRQLRPAADRLAKAGAGPSYFEFMTAMAFSHFAAEKCAVAIIETGLGGRLDATNIVRPEVSVITSIGIDHREFLGDTLAAIASEKAGIIKPARPVVIGRLPQEAEDVIRTIAVERGARVISVVQEFGADSSRYPTTRLRGDYQRANAATATLAAQAMPPAWRLGPDVIVQGLQRVEWAGRWQELKAGSADIILDAAHNAEGAVALEQNLSRLEKARGGKPVIVVGVLGTERARTLLPVIARHAARIQLVVTRQSRACSFAELEALLPVEARTRAQRTSVEALFPSPGVCAETGTVVVTGSIYLVGEVLARIDPAQGPLEAQLQDF